LWVINKIEMETMNKDKGSENTLTPIYFITLATYDCNSRTGFAVNMSTQRKMTKEIEAFISGRTTELEKEARITHK
jgi:hypothetical protein